MEAELRFATTEAEREEIFRLRYLVYIEEMSKPYPTADRERRMFSDPLDRTARLLFARAGGEVVGTLRVHRSADGSLPEELEAAYGLDRFRAPGDAAPAMSVLSRLMVRQDHRSGTLTIDLLRKFAEAEAGAGTELIFLQCHPHLVNFYGALGFRASGRVVNDPAAGVLIPMVLLTGDREHLERLRSPLAPAFRRREGQDGRELVRRVLGALPESSGIFIEGAQSDDFWAEVTGVLNQGMATKGILDGLPEEMVKSLFARSLIMECKEGDFLIRKDQVLRTVFIVLSGSLEILDGERPIQIATEGDVIGEVAFLLGTKRTRDVRAIGTGTRVLALSERALKALIDSDSRGAALLLLNLAKALASKLAYGTLGRSQ